MYTTTEFAYLFTKLCFQFDDVLFVLKDWLFLLTFCQPIYLQIPDLPGSNNETQILQDILDELRMSVGTLSSYLHRHEMLSWRQLHEFCMLQIAMIEKFKTTSGTAQDASAYIVCLKGLLSDLNNLQARLSGPAELEALSNPKAHPGILWLCFVYLLRYLVLVSVNILIMKTPKLSPIIYEPWMLDFPYLPLCNDTTYDSCTQILSRRFDTTNKSWSLSLDSKFICQSGNRIHDFFYKVMSAIFLEKGVKAGAEISILIQAAFLFHCSFPSKQLDAVSYTMDLFGKCVALCHSNATYFTRFLQALFLNVHFIQNENESKEKAQIKSYLFPPSSEKTIGQAKEEELLLNSIKSRRYPIILSFILYDRDGRQQDKEQRDLIEHNPEYALRSIVVELCTKLDNDNASAMTSSEQKDFTNDLDDIYFGYEIEDFTDKKNVSTLKIGYTAFDKLKKVGYVLHTDEIGNLKMRHRLKATHC